MTAADTTPIPRRRRIAAATLLAGAGAVAAAGLGTASPAHASSYPYVAIGFSHAVGSSSYGRGTTAEEARNDAITNCVNFGGTDCELVVSGPKDWCVAIAVDGYDNDRLHGAAALTREAAATLARLLNHGGTIHRTVCPSDF